jgi:hypothetical protein
MGLLDNMMGNEQLMLGLGLLNAGAPQAVRPNFGGGLMQALGGVQQIRDANQARQDRQLELAMKQKLQDAQIAEYQAQAQERAAQAQAIQRKAVEQQRIQDLLKAQFSPVSGTQANAASGITGPRPEALGVVGQTPQPNFQQLIAAGVPLDVVKGLAEARNYGRDKVERTIETTDERGMPGTAQFTGYGDRVGGVLPKAVEMKLMNLGGSEQAYNPFALQQGQQFQRTVDPGTLFTGGITMRGQNMTDARSREQNALSGQMNALKLNEMQQKAADVAQTKDSARASYEIAIGTLDRLAEHPGLSAAVGQKNPLKGSFGFYTIPGTEAANFKSELEAFRSQTFLPMVQSLRGMGALSDAEGKKLTAAVGALDENMSEDAFKASAGRIRSELEAAYKRAGGANLPAGKPRIGEIRKGYRFKGGDPALESSWELP